LRDYVLWRTRCREDEMAHCKAFALNRDGVSGIIRSIEHQACCMSRLSTIWTSVKRFKNGRVLRYMLKCEAEEVSSLSTRSLACLCHVALYENCSCRINHRAASPSIPLTSFELCCKCRCNYYRNGEFTPLKRKRCSRSCIR
jgi:hypothetical protein